MSEQIKTLFQEHDIKFTAARSSILEVLKEAHHPLNYEQIKEKMKKFKIDDSRVKVNNEVRIRYADSKDKKSKTDARMQTEMTFTL